MTFDEIAERRERERAAQSRRERAAEALNGVWWFYSDCFTPGTTCSFEEFRVKLAVAELSSAIFDAAAEDEGYENPLERARALTALACEMGLVRLHSDATIEFLRPPRRTPTEPDYTPHKRRGIDNRVDLVPQLVSPSRP